MDTSKLKTSVKQFIDNPTGENFNILKEELEKDQISQPNEKCVGQEQFDKIINKSSLEDLKNYPVLSKEFTFDEFNQWAIDLFDSANNKPITGIYPESYQKEIDDRMVELTNKPEIKPLTKLPDTTNFKEQVKEVYDKYYKNDKLYIYFKTPAFRKGDIITIHAINGGKTIVVKDHYRIWYKQLWRWIKSLFNIKTPEPDSYLYTLRFLDEYLYDQEQQLDTPHKDRLYKNQYPRE